MNSVLRVHIKTFYLNIFTNHNNTSSFTLSFTLIHSLYSFTLFTLTFLMLNIHSLESIYTFCNDRLSAINTCAKLNSENQFTSPIVLKSEPLYFKSDLDAPNTSEFTWSNFIRFRDKNDVNVAGIQTAVDSNGQGVLVMQVYPNGGGNLAKEIRLLNDRAYCPTPPSNSNSTEIATCQWVNDAINSKVTKTPISKDNFFSKLSSAPMGSYFYAKLLSGTTSDNKSVSINNPCAFRVNPSGLYIIEGTSVVVNNSTVSRILDNIIVYSNLLSIFYNTSFTDRTEVQLTTITSVDTGYLIEFN